MHMTQLFEIVTLTSLRSGRPPASDPWTCLAVTFSLEKVYATDLPAAHLDVDDDPLVSIDTSRATIGISRNLVSGKRFGIDKFA